MELFLSTGIPHCGELANDCVQDVTSKYDWTKCEGMHSCVQTLRKMRTPTECDTSNNVPQSDTDRATEGKVDTQQYLQVEYNCILSKYRYLQLEYNSALSIVTEIIRNTAHVHIIILPKHLNYV